MSDAVSNTKLCVLTDALLFPGLRLLQAADVATGVSTVATSLSSAAVSLAGPFLRQASKQVGGCCTDEAMACTAAVPRIANKQRNF